MTAYSHLNFTSSDQTKLSARFYDVHSNHPCSSHISALYSHIIEENFEKRKKARVEGKERTGSA